MHPNRRAKRPPKFDTITHPDASADETRKHYTLAPFNRIADEMDRKWGIDRLPELVSVDLARKFGDTMADLNKAITTGTPDEVVAWAGVGVRAYVALDKAAEEAGQPKADQEVWEIEVDGERIGVMRDDKAWQSIKAARPDLKLITLRESVLAAVAYDMTSGVLDEIKSHFPDASVSSVKPTDPVNYAAGGDEIRF
ncbi:hypothetical protein AB3Y40_06705 [Yoonia sp. R2331]|uniref:hypothetical protein n=1 Tax=Yoonia sp. R2331 TaxID=3237238 RepID=UPI0034E4508F